MSNSDNPLGDAATVALQDQYAAAAREAEAIREPVGDMLVPEGVSARVTSTVSVLEDLRQRGPVTVALVNWLEDDPHVPACSHTLYGPAPLFALHEFPRDAWCLACFIPRWDRWRQTENGWCGVCRFEAEAVAPMLASTSIFTVALLVCEHCRDEEVKAAKRPVQERWQQVIEAHRRDRRLRRGRRGRRGGLAGRQGLEGGR